MPVRRAAQCDALARNQTGQLAVVRTRRGCFLPGGDVEGEETPLQTIEREAREECGLVLVPRHVVGRAVEIVYSAEERTCFEKRSVFIAADTASQISSTEPDHTLVWLFPAAAPDGTSDTGTHHLKTGAERIPHSHRPNRMSRRLVIFAFCQPAEQRRAAYELLRWGSTPAQVLRGVFRSTTIAFSLLTISRRKQGTMKSTRPMSRVVTLAFGLTALFAPVSAHADPISINVLSTTYSNNIAITDSGGTVTKTATGSDPVSTSLDAQGVSGDSVHASASADWLAVSVEIDNAPFSSLSGSAAADFDLTFSTVADATAALGVDLTRSGEHGSGLATLFDVTTQEALWSVAFGSDFGGCDICPVIVTQGGIQSLGGSSGLVALSTALSAGDIYDLHLTASTGNTGFNTFSSLQVSGLVSVPEPSSISLLIVGIGGVLASRKKRRLT